MQVDLSDDYADLVAGSFDMAVRIGTLPDSSLVARRLAPNRRVLCASPVYLEKHGEPRDLEELQRHRLVAAGPQVTWRFEGPEGPVDFQAPHRARDQLQRSGPRGRGQRHWVSASAPRGM